jgi:uncharacterized membrane protein
MTAQGWGSMATTHLLKISRLEGLTDGIFAIAMTILVLDLHIPRDLAVNMLLHVMKSEVFFRIYVYVASFAILGTLWVAMNFQLGLLERLNRVYLWTNIFYLMVICVVPFSASLIGAYPTNPESITFFAVNLLFASLGQFLTAQCSYYYKLNKSFYHAALRNAVLRRIFFAPPFYIAAMFMAHWHTDIAFILLFTPILAYMIPGRVDTYEGIEG